MRIALPILTLLAVAAGFPAAAYDPIVIARGWTRVDYHEGTRCTGEVGTNGRIYILSVTGFEPGERARLTIVNGDMPPIRRAVRADARGQWQDYYIPFRPNRGEGGYVTATLAGTSCEVPLGFAWHRNKGWDES